MITQVRERGLVLPKTIVRVEKQMYPPPANSVLYFPGYPPLGNTITDFSGSANHGTISGATWTRLPSGLWCLSFDGTDDYITLSAYATAINIVEPVTISFWAKSANDDIQTVFGQRNSVGEAFDLSIGNNATGTLTNELFTIAHNIDGVTTRVGYTTATRTEFYDGKYHKWDLVCDGTDYLLYLDASLKAITVGQGADNGLYQTSGCDTVRIGSNSATPVAFGFVGTISLFRIRGAALSATTITNIYNREKHLFGV